MKNKELLFSITKDDFQIERTKGSGKGGQNRNKRETAIRLTHKATGIQSYCADERSQDQNLKRAWKNLINKPEFKNWLKIKIARENMNQKEIKEQINKWVEEQIQDKYLKVEFF